MKFTDLIMPHRFFINRSLNKESEKLKSKIDEYKIEYNSKIQRCQQEIEALKEKKNQDYMDVVNSLNKELEKDAELFVQFKNVFLKYVDLYLGKQLLFQRKNILRLEKKVKIDYGDFLTNQISAISDEIKILEERKVIKRRIKSVTAPRIKRKTTLTPAERAQRLKAKARYKKNRAKILKAAKERRKKLTSAEKAFNKKRAEYLRKTRKTSGAKKHS